MSSSGTQNNLFKLAVECLIQALHCEFQGILGESVSEFIKYLAASGNHHLVAGMSLMMIIDKTNELDDIERKELFETISKLSPLEIVSRISCWMRDVQKLKHEMGDDDEWPEYVLEMLLTIVGGGH